MDIAYVTNKEQGKSDAVLSQIAKKLARQGLRVAGVVQKNTDRSDCRGCDMDLSVLPDGPTIRISQLLGRGARGCKLDPSALETAVVEVQKRLGNHIDILILNKFGKHEAEGRGFRALIADALTIRVPVLTSVNHLNEDAFLEFSDGLATKISTDAKAVLKWVGTIRVSLKQSS